MSLWVCDQVNPQALGKEMLLVPRPLEAWGSVSASHRCLSMLETTGSSVASAEEFPHLPVSERAQCELSSDVQVSVTNTLVFAKAGKNLFTFTSSTPPQKVW